jgi:hypothetical protein
MARTVHSTLSEGLPISQSFHFQFLIGMYGTDLKDHFAINGE